MREEVIGGQRLLLGDCLDILPSLAAGSVDAVITDPPYGVTNHAWDCLFRQDWLDELLRVCCGSTLVFNAARPDVMKHMLSMVPTPRRVIAWRQPCVTAGYGMFWSWQPIYCWGHDFLGWDTVEFPCVERDGHPTQKPIKLICGLLARSTQSNNSVLDPFMGSGTTLVAAELLGRRGIGIEIDEGYYDIACRRVEEAAAQPRLEFDDREADAAQLTLDTAPA
jgi:site-specific DNA-methyltransferase (adenine-specific)